MLSQLPADEILQLRITAIKLLEKINNEIDLPDESGQGARLFGNKGCVVDTLVTLADLLLRLRPSIATEDKAQSNPSSLNEKDMAVVRAFLERSHSNAAPNI